MSTNLLSCFPFPQITFSFPLNIFPFLNKVLHSLHSNVHGGSVFYHNKVLCSFPYFFSNNTAFFFFLNFLVLSFGYFWVEDEGRRGQWRGHWTAFFHWIIYDLEHDQGSVGRKKCRNEAVYNEAHADSQGAREGTRGQARMGRRFHWNRKSRGQNMAPKWASLGDGNNLLCPLSFPSFSVFFPNNSFSPLLYPKPAKEAWQPIGDGELMGRANRFPCFVQMCKQTITYNHYPIIIHHTGQFNFPGTKYVTGTVFVTNCTIGYAGLV